MPFSPNSVAAALMDALATVDPIKDANEFILTLADLVDAGFIARNAEDDGWELTTSGRKILDKATPARH